MSRCAVVALRKAFAFYGLMLPMLASCSWIDKGSDVVEKTMNKQKSCAFEQERVGQGYTTEQYYRCVGAGCQDYGCKK